MEFGASRLIDRLRLLRGAYPKGPLRGAWKNQIGPLEEELKNLDRAHRETLRLIEAQPAGLFEEERSHPALGFRRKVAVILFGINDHEVHHRAQLMTYLRMLGTLAPEPFKRPAK